MNDLVENIHRVLDEIHDPCSVSMSMPMGLHEMGLVKSVEVEESGRVRITLRLTSPFCEMVPFMTNEAVRRISPLDGVTDVVVENDGGMDWDQDLIAPAAQERRRLRLLTMDQMPPRRVTPEVSRRCQEHPQRLMSSQSDGHRPLT